MMKSKWGRFGLGLFLLGVFLSLGVHLAWGAAVSRDAGNYFPLKTGNKWVYAVSLPDNGTYRQTVQVMAPDSNGYIKLHISSDNSLLAELYFSESKQGLFKVKEISIGGEIQFDPPLMALNSRLKVGKNWNWESKDGKMKEKVRVVAAEKVVVPAGTFQTLVVQCEGVDDQGNSYLDKTWYTKKVGYVKHAYSSNGRTATMELSEYVVGK